MKQKWSTPQLNVLGIVSTMQDGPVTLDLGHGYDEVNHSHHCTCGLYFPTWAAAEAHEKEMTLAGQSNYHNIGCDIIS